ncbi:MAG: hypothetical protein JW983_02795 [Elusimicrobia bacterium]|nr:hypothetical protein [Elusimicrobiota bacterium]
MFFFTNKKKLTDSTVRKFGAVVVVNEIRKGQKKQNIETFLSQHEQKKIILFNAVGTKYWKSNVVDWKSAAEDRKGSDKSDKSLGIAKNIVEEIRAVLKVQNK